MKIDPDLPDLPWCERCKRQVDSFSITELLDCNDIEFRVRCHGETETCRMSRMEAVLAGSNIRPDVAFRNSKGLRP